jgi:hypothetical protein
MPLYLYFHLYDVHTSELYDTYITSRSLLCECELYVTWQLAYSGAELMSIVQVKVNRVILYNSNPMGIGSVDTCRLPTEKSFMDNPTYF